MIKGVFLAAGIMILGAVIPVVNLAGVPFGPFIGGYYGILYVRNDGWSYAAKSLAFGCLLGLLVALALVGVGVALMLTMDLSQRFTLLLWIGVAVYTLYTASMAALGSMYRQLRAAANDAE